MERIANNFSVKLTALSVTVKVDETGRPSHKSAFDTDCIQLAFSLGLIQL